MQLSRLQKKYTQKRITKKTVEKAAGADISVSAVLRMFNQIQYN